MDALEKAKKFFNILDNKKAINLKLFATNDKSLIADYFVIATGTSSTHVKALAEEVEYEMKKLGIKVRGIEGHGSNMWILLDYDQVVVHIFTEDNRNYYNIEELWSGMEEVCD